MAMPGQPRLALAIVFVMTVVATHAAQAQTFTVLHNFTGGADGGTPIAGLTIDQAGNFYGTTFGLNWGTVFKLAHKNSSWVLTPLYSFSGGDDGASPFAGVTIGLNGILYGTTFEGGTYGYGTVFDLKPSAAACRTALCPWTETVLCGFTGGSDGANPVFGDLVFDQAGNLYGTAEKGGAYGYGVVYELMPSNGGWTERVLYAFAGANDGAIPESALIFDKAGNLYGTADGGGAYGYGTVYELKPSGAGWAENVLHAFQGGNDGQLPVSGLVFDQSGNLYGSTLCAGSGNGGTVYELTPNPSGNWAYAVLYSFNGTCGGGPYGSLVMDARGNLLGTTHTDGAYSFGNVFKLTPSNGGWTYNSLYDFTGGSDGAYPVGGVVFDANGDLYGTTVEGGAYGYGVVFEITP